LVFGRPLIWVGEQSGIISCKIGIATMGLTNSDKVKLLMLNTKVVFLVAIHGQSLSKVICSDYSSSSVLPDLRLLSPVSFLKINNFIINNKRLLEEIQSAEL
jgi:hypothetical protein